MDGSWDFRLSGLLVGNNLLWLLYQSFCNNLFEIQQWYVFTNFNINNMTVYISDIYEIKKYSQVKVILTFMTKSVSSCFLIHYICTTHAVIAVKLDNVRIKNRNVIWILLYVDQNYAQARLKILLQMIYSSDRWLVCSRSLYLPCLVLCCWQSDCFVLFCSVSMWSRYSLQVFSSFCLPLVLKCVWSLGQQHWHLLIMLKHPHCLDCQ